MNRDILGFLFLVLAIVLAILFFMPKVQDVRTVTIDMKAKQSLVKSRDTRIQALKQIQAAFAQQPERIQKLASVLPPEPQVPELLVAAEALGVESGVALTSITPQVSSQDKAVYLTLVGDGPLAGVEALARLIAENARPMSVTTVSYQRAEGGRSLSFTIVVKAPYNDPEADLPAASGVEEAL